MCGIFGFLLIDERQFKHVSTLLQRMIWVTMVRGAQAGGVVTYAQYGRDVRAVRTRVLNGKRTDLSHSVPKAVVRNVRRSQLCTPRIYQGHTRFATSSIADFEGTHPHRWSRPAVESVWSLGQNPQRRMVTRELYVCHNGDFDCFTFKGDQTYTLEDVQDWLVRATGCKPPCMVDSAAVAGMLDIIYAQGCWYRAVRFGYHLGMKRVDLEYEVDERSLRAAAKALEHEFANGAHREELIKVASELDVGISGAEIFAWARTTVDAFFQNDLLTSVEYFLDHAMGSFGLAVTASDASAQICLAARGQPLSVAFYSDCGAVLFASELSAVKAGMDVLEESFEATRLELDHVGGEVCLLDARPSVHKEPMTAFIPKSSSSDSGGSKITDGRARFSFFGGLARFTTVRLIPDVVAGQNRWTQLYDNPLVLPLPPPQADPVGADIAHIPEAVKHLVEDWHKGRGSFNRLTAFTWGRVLLERLNSSRRVGDHIDILVVGCEASLWVGEQFAADLKLIMPKLCVQATSSNKLLGLFGQDYALYQTGFQLSEEAGSWVLCDTIILLISHSGCTFSSLLCTTLLQCFSEHIFVLTSEFDTLMAREVRDDDAGPKMTPVPSRYVFSTDVGFRPAEPVSVSFVACHVLLSLLLEYTMMVLYRSHMIAEHCMSLTTDSMSLPMSATFRKSKLGSQRVDAMKVVGASFTRDDLCMFVEHMNRMPSAIHAIVEGEAGTALRAEGKYLANHVLESPLVWIIVAIYVFATVSFQAPIVGVIVDAFTDLEAMPQLSKIANVLDAIVYIFAAQLVFLVLRLIQGRKLFHRMSGRTILIADVPMVGQIVRAFASKCFACTYSNTMVNFFNGSPTDHLLHRFTHQTCRGSLLVVGRPDGRLADLTAAEAATCLAVKQACSIQNFGVTAEAITVGHNPFALGCARSNITLPTSRPRYLCESLLSGDSSSPGAIIGQLKNSALTAAERTVVMTRRTAKLRRSTFHQRLAANGRQGPARAMPRSSSGDSTSTSMWEERNNADHLSPTRSMLHAGFDEILNRPNTSVATVFGLNLITKYPERSVPELLCKQSVSIRLYEGRFATIERAVSFFVMFHEMAKRVQRFWAFFWWLGLGYRIDRSQSNCRVMTTASPVSGMDILDSMVVLKKIQERRRAIRRIDHLLADSISRWKFHKWAESCASKTVNADLSPLRSKMASWRMTAEASQILPHKGDKSISRMDTDEDAATLADI